MKALGSRYIIGFGLLVLLSLFAPIAHFYIRIINPNVVIPDEQILETEAYPFWAERLSFQGIRYDAETSLLEFEITTRHQTPEDYFDSIHETATSTGWHLVTSSTLQRVYQINSSYHPATGTGSRVTLEFRPRTGRIRIKEERIY
jgi:hypothetical protein